jgi:DNA-binding PadR family transcriptional regulator
LQKRIILHLAQNKPQTIYKIAQEISKTKKGIPKNYKSSWTAFKALKKKGLIKHITSSKYHGRRYPCFWLTELGVFLALHERAKPEVLLKTTREIYPKNEDLHFLIKGVPILGKHVLDVLYLAVLKRGKINQTDLTTIFAAQMLDKFTPEQITKFIATLKEYPKIHQQTSKNLTKLSDLVKYPDASRSADNSKNRYAKPTNKNKTN